MRPRRLDFQERVVPKTRVTGTEPNRAWRPRFEADPSDFTLITHPDETFISPTSPGDAIPDDHISIDDVLAGIVESPYPMEMLTATPRPPSTPSQRSTDDEYEPPAHPGVTTLFAPAEGITTSASSLDPRRFEPDALDPSNLENITPHPHEEEIMISASNPEMPPEGTLLAVPSIITMEIG